MTQIPRKSVSPWLVGCGIVLVFFAVLLGAIGYGGWRAWHSFLGGNWTVRVGDKVRRSFSDGLAKSEFNWKSDDHSAQNTDKNNSMFTNSLGSVSSECLSPLLSVTPKKPDQWASADAGQRHAVLSRLGEFSKTLPDDYRGPLLVNRHEQLVASLNKDKKRFCVVHFSTPLPSHQTF